MPEKSVNELPRELRPLFTKGNEALTRDNFDYAIDLFSQVLVQEPTVFECRKALRKAQQGKAGKGGGFFKKVLSNAGAQPQLTKAKMIVRDDPGQALAIAEQVLSSDPTNSGAHRVIVDAAANLQLPRTAAMSLEVLHQNSPKDKKTTIEFGTALAEINDVARAEKILMDLQYALPNDPDVSKALKNISAKRTLHEGGYNQLEGGQGSYRDILRNAKEATSLEQENRVVKNEDVTTRLIGEYEERLPKEPGNLKLLRSLAELYTQKKQFDRALEYYDRIKTSDMGNDSSLDSAIANTKGKKFDHEIEKLDAAAPDHSDRVAQIGAEKIAYQLAECQKRVERFPTDLAFRHELGVMYFQAGKISEAIQEFQKAKNSPHKRIPALNYLAQCFAKRKMYDLAAKQLQEALKEKLVFDDEKKDLIYNLGTVFEGMGKKEEAIEQFKQIYEADIGYRDVGAKVDAYYAAQ